MDVDRIVGRVVCVSGSQVVVALDPDLAPEALDSPLRLEKGSIVKMPQRTSVVFGIVVGLSIPVPGRREEGEETRLAELELLGEWSRSGEDNAFRRGISAFPALGDPVLAVDREDLVGIYRRRGAATVALGTIHQDREQPVHATPDDLLGKHLAVLGASGSGKSCAVTLLLHDIIDQHPNAHIIVLDPHNEYRQAFGERAEALGTDTLQLPYWLLTFEEMALLVAGSGQRSRTAEAAVGLLGELIPEAKRAFRHDQDGSLQITVDTPVPYRISDLDQLLDEAMGRLDKPDSLAPYRWLRARLAAVTSDSRYAFMFGSLTVHDNMARILSRIFRVPVAGKPVAILDLSAVPFDILNVVISVLARITFDFALWGRGAEPILLVCDEVHRYAPADARLGFEPATDGLAKIAKEGRKYGLSLCVVSQRPSEVAPEVLSQCGSVFAFRMTGSRDQETLRALLGDNAFGLLDFLPNLGDAEAIVAGPAVSVPVRLKLPEVPAARRPHSARASFSEAWKREAPAESFVQEVVDIWRRQQR